MDDLFMLFRSRFESLGGHVGFARNVDEAAAHAGEFIRQNDAASVFVSNIPSEVEPALTRELRVRGLRVFSKGTTSDALSVVKEVDAGVSSAACGVAETGTLVEVAFDDVERLLSSLPKVYVSFLRRSMIYRSVYSVSEVIRRAAERKTSAVTFISGPSRSGDIEQRLVLGIHGPHAVSAVVLNWL
ncbi:MAG: lactate utilization protein [Candidatus Caldarchaeum sp.]|nr:lactate utilization protein [Candidatus Caldarchaeum sp.]